MAFKDNMTDWYAKCGKGVGNSKIKNDKNFKKHMIKPCSRIMLIGNSGSGKTTALLELIHRQGEKYYDMIIFNPATTDEPLLNYLGERIEGIKFINDPDELPDLTEFDDDSKHLEKLIVFDDIINLPKKDLVKIQKWANSSRKMGFTNLFLVQNYTDAPIQIRRNCQYFMIFRLNDVNTIKQILKNHNNNGDNKEAIMEAYFHATEKPKDFFTLDLTPDSPARYRHNFTDIIHI